MKILNPELFLLLTQVFTVGANACTAMVYHETDLGRPTCLIWEQEIFHRPQHKRQELLSTRRFSWLNNVFATFAGTRVYGLCLPPSECSQPFAMQQVQAWYGCWSTCRRDLQQRQQHWTGHQVLLVNFKDVVRWNPWGQGVEGCWARSAMVVSVSITGMKQCNHNDE